MLGCQTFVPLTNLKITPKTLGICLYYPSGELTKLNVKYVYSLILAQFHSIHVEKALLP